MISKPQKSLEEEQDGIKTKLYHADSAIIDLQCRSMGDNLIFTGISESGHEQGDTETTLCNYSKQEMNIKDAISFHKESTELGISTEKMIIHVQ